MLHFGCNILIAEPIHKAIKVDIVRYVRNFSYEAILQEEVQYCLTKYKNIVDIPRFTYIGKFRITGYCSSELCTGKYGLNRPWVGGREIAITASGAVAEVGITIATDPSVIPFGTVVYIEGLGIRIAQDVGGAVRNNHIDVFFRTHEEALR